MLLLQTDSGLATAIADTAQKVGITTANAAAQPENFDFSVWSMIEKGGLIMIPIGILLALTIFVLIERLIIVNKALAKNTNLLSGIRELINKGNIESARAMCRTNAAPESVMLEKGISRIGQPMSEIRETMSDVAQVEIAKLEKRMNILNLCGRIAPLLGFIGTIIGVIQIFYDINHAGTVDIEHVSGGLYVKMVSSAGGLVVGVIAFICYHWINSMIDRVALRLEESQVKFLDILQEPQA